MSQLEFDEIGALKVRVAELEEKVDFLFRSLKLQYNPEGTDSGIDPEIQALVRQGKKIEAIKRLRDQTHMGLAQAKDAIEEIEGRIK